MAADQIRQNGNTSQISNEEPDTTSTNDTGDSTFAQSSEQIENGESSQNNGDDTEDAGDSAIVPTTTESQDIPGTQADASDTLVETNNVKTATFQRNAGLGVLGTDYIEHQVRLNDTLQGICLTYNISAVRLRQANLLSGDNESLLLAPHKILAIPISEGFYSRIQETDSEDYKLNVLRKQFPKLSKKEATAYLELADWVLDEALATAREDIAWEKETKNDIF